MHYLSYSFGFGLRFREIFRTLLDNTKDGALRKLIGNADLQIDYGRKYEARKFSDYWSIYLII